MKHRIAARGLLIENNSVCFIEYQNKEGEFSYALPGGGQEIGVDLRQTLIREFAEETGIVVVPGDIILVREFIYENALEEFWGEQGIHQVEVFFKCTRADNEVSNESKVFDMGMTGVKWIPVNELSNYTIYPVSELLELIDSRSINYHYSAQGNL